MKDKILLSAADLFLNYGFKSVTMDDLANKIGISKKYASRWGVILVLKGAPTIISEQGGAFWLNPNVNSGLATAGSGDVLTGLIIGFLAQRTTALAAAVSGVYIHSCAGEILKEKMGEHSIIAGDLIDAIPSAIMKALKANEN